MIDETTAEVVHYCRPPRLEYMVDDDTDDDVVRSLRLTHPIGTRYHCDGCPTVWVATMIPEQRGRYVVVCAHPRWTRETRAERRDRLGLRPWWRFW